MFMDWESLSKKKKKETPFNIRSVGLTICIHFHHHHQVLLALLHFFPVAPPPCCILHPLHPPIRSIAYIMSSLASYKGPKPVEKPSAVDIEEDEDDVLISADTLPEHGNAAGHAAETEDMDMDASDKPKFAALKASEMTVRKQILSFFSSREGRLSLSPWAEL